MAQSSHHVDVVVIGDGLVGLTVAIALAQLPLKIAVIGLSSSSAPKNSLDDSKTIALTHRSEKLLCQWLGIELKTITPIKRVHVSVRGRWHKLRFEAQNLGVEALGYLIGHKQLHHQLTTCSKSQLSLEFYKTTADYSLAHDRRRLVIDVDEKPFSLSYRLLVVADGRNSKTTTSLGFTRQILSPKSQALLAKVVANSVAYDQYTAFQRFTKAGTIAMLPLKKNYYKLVITAKPSLIQRWQILSDQAFIDRLKEVLGGYFSQLQRVSNPVVYPLQSTALKSAILPAVVVIGDAAHTLSPIVAQGFNLSLVAVDCLTQQIKKALVNGNDFASFASLSRYQQQRQISQDNMIRFVAKLELAGQYLNKLPIDSVVAILLGFANHCLPFHQRLGRWLAGIDSPN